MASVLLDADKISKGKSKLCDKVYTRRFKRTTTNAAVATAAAFPTATVTTTATEHTNDNSDQNQQPTGNGVIKQVVSLVDGLVKINLKAAKSKNEISELTETMKSELERVRRLAQKLEDKEAELTALSTIVSDNEAYNHSRYSVNDIALTRVNSEVGLVTNGDMRPFGRLTVSVGNDNHGVGGFVEKEKRTPKANPYYRNSEFLLGKDRLPVESNKRQKSNSGRKHTKESDSVKNQVFKNCSNLLQRLMRHKHGWVFNEPVNAKKLGLHDYHDIIKHPMDLGTIKSRLAQNFYKSPMDFADDVRLIFRNAMTYNPKGHDVHAMAEQLLNIFEERWAVIESESNPNLRYGMIYDANSPTPTSRKAPHFAHPPSRMLYRPESTGAPVMAVQRPSISVPISRTPAPKKPKAKDPNKRNMTYEEKQKLSTNLQSLPSEKLDNIIQIIKKNTSLSQHDDEIEVDIDSVDVETLWELDRFVTNYKKNLSKHKRKAALAQQARLEAGDVNQTVVNDLANSLPKAPKEDKTQEKTLASTLDNASSSSSSSSDSGSSSSDTDSDSSSD